jgi:hypothetical protein
MAASQLEIDAYIADVRSAFADYGEALALKQRIGRTDIYCDRVKLMLLSSYIDCVYDYLLQYPNDTDPDITNLFTKAEIRDVMQHINNICKTNYILSSL